MTQGQDLFHKISLKLMSNEQRINYYKDKKKEKHKRIRNRTPKQKERNRIKRIKIRNYQKQRTKRRKEKEKEKNKQRLSSKCKLKNGQRSKKIPLKAVYCHNCSPSAWNKSYKNYCERSGKGKYVANCSSCVTY